jgi:UDP-glucose 4-epimerase
LAEAVDFEVVAAVSPRSQTDPLAGTVLVRELGADSRWQDVLESVDTIVHTAARVHEVNDSKVEAGFRRVNVDATLNLARQAAHCGVRRFVFLSSVKVHGEYTRPGHSFSADDQPAPVGAYAKSKYDAEIGLLRLMKCQDMEVVTIRPPLVYGPGVKANFLTLMRWVDNGYPLPFGRIHNARSLIALNNLVDLIRVCCVHPAAANRTFLAADGEDVSTAELVSRLGIALKRPAPLLPVPPKLLLALATLAGKRDLAGKLLGNLQIDSRSTREVLEWMPPVGMEEALESTVLDYLKGVR